MINKRILFNLLLGIKTILIFGLLFLTSIWIASTILPWWINRNFWFQFFKYTITFSTFFYLFIDGLFIWMEFKKIKKEFIENSNRILVKKVIWFLLKIITFLSIFVVIVLFNQNTQDFTNLTSIYFQNTPTLFFYGFMVFLSFVLSIIEIFRINISLKRGI